MLSCKLCVDFINPVLAVMVGWLLAMLLRQAGHFVFEPLTYDEVNDASHEYKEKIKVGYNLRRKAILLTVWILVPVTLLVSPARRSRPNERFRRW